MIEPHGFSNLGAKEAPLTGSEYKLVLGSAMPRPAVLMNQKAFNKPVFYQRQLPTCGANAGAFLAELLDQNAGAVYNPRYQWIDIKSKDGLALSDGTTMDAIFKSLLRGELPLGDLDDDTTLPLATYSNPSIVTPAIQAEAVQTVSTYAFHTEQATMDDLKQLIFQNGAVLLLIRIGNEFWTDKNGNVSWNETDILPLRTPTNVISGHFIVAHSYDEQYIYFANWWSAAWGRAGHGYFADNYLPQIVGVGTIVDSIAKVIVPTFTKDLYLGVTDPQVQQLQHWLNTNGYPVAPAGHPGSTGNETSYYGPATQAAVRSLQIANNILPTAGYFGPRTRAFVNARLSTS